MCSVKILILTCNAKNVANYSRHDGGEERRGEGRVVEKEEEEQCSIYLVIIIFVY